MNSEDSLDNKCLINEILVLYSILAIIVLLRIRFADNSVVLPDKHSYGQYKEYKGLQSSLQLDLIPLPLKNRIYRCFLKRQAKIYFGVHGFMFLTDCSFYEYFYSDKHHLRRHLQMMVSLPLTENMNAIAIRKTSMKRCKANWLQCSGVVGVFHLGK